MTAATRHSPAEAFFAWRPAGVGAVFIPCGWCPEGGAVRLSENLLEALCPSCANSLALGRARAIAHAEGAQTLIAHLRALDLSVEGDLAGGADLLDHLIDSGCLRRDLRLVLELDSEAGTHAYSAAPLREVVLPEEVVSALDDRRRRGGVLSELLGQRLRDRLATTIRSIGPEAGLECFRGEGANPSLLPQRVQRLLGALPLRREPEGALVLAVWDPLDRELAQDLGRLVEGPVHLVLADPDALSAALPSALAPDAMPAESEEAVADLPSAWQLGEPREDPVQEVLLEALEEGAGELLLEPSEGDAASLRFRVRGELREARQVPLEVLLAFAELIAPRGQQGPVATGSIRYEVPGLPVDLDYRRVETPLGPSLAFSLEEPHERRALNLGQLGLSLDALAEFEAVLATGRGLLVIGAPQAHERSRAYHATLERAARLGGAVVSLERRVRRVLPVTQLQVTHEADLEGICSPRPDWLAIDGVLTPHSLRLALDCALAGKAAVVTVPAVDARTALGRLEFEGVPPALLQSTVSAVLVRRVLSELCPHCRFRVEEGNDALWVGLGCVACAEQGVRGELPVAELVRPTARGLAHVRGSESLAERCRRLVAEGAVTCAPNPRSG
jgi:type II secretory ATPase GspE/PulE/Tfp pilus assembly ATPase PilB-like protein